MDRRPDKSQLKPTGDWLIVEPLNLPEHSTGGIVMPTSASRPDKYGKVIATGPGFYQNGVRVEPWVKNGQTVMFKAGRGLEMRFDGDHVLFMTERDLLAVVE